MYRDTIETTYALRDDAIPLVQRGDTVAAGDVIARGGGPPAIVPYAALLRLSADAAAAAIVRQNGATCTVGASLGTRRIGLMTHTVSAPAGGSVRGFPNSGALAIRDETATGQYRARYPGTVRERSDRAIVITSDVARCVYAFADKPRGIGALHIEQALLRAASAAETAAQLPHAASCTVIAHISDAEHLASVSRSFDGTLLVGSVTEPVAWALWDRSVQPSSRHSTGPGLVVLDGAGDARHGMRAVAPFRHFDGAAIAIDRFTQTIIVVPSSDFPLEGEGFPLFVLENHGERRDPANYGMSCDTLGAPQFALTSGGARALCTLAIGDPGGAERIPAQNLRRLPRTEE